MDAIRCESVGHAREVFARDVEIMGQALGLGRDDFVVTAELADGSVTIVARAGVMGDGVICAVQMPGPNIDERTAERLAHVFALELPNNGGNDDQTDE